MSGMRRPLAGDSGESKYPGAVKQALNPLRFAEPFW
jgi:hypothetical protein